MHAFSEKSAHFICNQVTTKIHCADTSNCKWCYQRQNSALHEFATCRSDVLNFYFSVHLQEIISRPRVVRLSHFIHSNKPPPAVNSDLHATLLRAEAAEFLFLPNKTRITQIFIPTVFYPLWKKEREIKKDIGLRGTVKKR